jgi:hypothetical protein
LLALLVLIAALAPPAGGAFAVDDPSSSNDRPGTVPATTPIDVNATQTIELTDEPGVVEVTFSVSIDNGTRSAGVYVPLGATIVTREHVERDARRSTTRYRGFSWTGVADDASVTYRVQVNESENQAQRYDAVGTTDWALFETSSALGAVRVDGSWVNVSSQPAGPGVVGDGYVFLGPHETFSRTIDGERLRLVVPAAADLRVERNATFAAVAVASRQFDIGAANGTVTMFAAPEPFRGGGQAIGNDFWVHADSGLHGANTWIHEYVHTRQTYGQSGKTAFVVEGVADYYAALFSLRAGNMTYGAFHDNIEAQEEQDMILAESDDDLGGVEYTKGRRVVGALDAKIRTATDGERSFQDVLTRLNRDASGIITYAEFKDAVEAVAGRSFDEWIDKYVLTSDAPQVPRDPSLHAQPGVDADGDGLSDRAELASGTNMRVADTDGDGLADGREVNELGTDPTDEDTDADGIGDGVEVEAGSDPTNAASRPEEPTADDGTVENMEDEMASDPESVPGFGVASTVGALVVAVLALRGRD